MRTAIVCSMKLYGDLSRRQLDALIDATIMRLRARRDSSYTGRLVAASLDRLASRPHTVRRIATIH